MSIPRLAVPLLLLALVGAWWLVGGARGGERHAQVPVGESGAALGAGARAPTPSARPARELAAPEAAAVARVEAVPEEPSPLASGRAATDEGDRVHVLVATRAFYTRQAAPVGGIAFRVHALRPIEARDRPADPFASFQAIDLEEAILFEGRTDERGEARVELARAGLRFDTKGVPLLGARVVEPGYQSSIAAARKVAGSAAEAEVWLQAKAGATARGRVVDAEGTPAAAVVRLRRWIAPKGEWKLDHGTRARLLAGGCFELDLERTETGVALTADARDAGTGALADVDLSLESPPQELVIRVSGPGVLRGRVLDGSGAPAAGLELHLVHVRLDEPSGVPILRDPERSRLELEGGGQLSGLRLTDPKGAFELRGLRDGLYVVRARTAESGAYEHLLTPTPVPADGAELELRLARPHVVVRLLDAEGRPWSGPPPVPQRPTRFRPPPSEWPAEPCVLLLAGATDGLEDWARGEPLPGKRTGPDQVVYEVEDDARYLVGVLGAGFDGTLRVVEVPAGAGAVPVELSARELGELGTLRVEVRAPAPARGSEDVRLRLEALSGAAVLLEGDPYARKAPWDFRVPAGRYRVVAEGAPGVDFQHGILRSPRASGRAEQTVEVLPGTAHEVTLELEAGARLEVSLAGQASAADEAAVLAQNEWLAEPGREAARAERAAQAELWLERPGRRPEPVIFRALGYEGTSAAGEHLFSRWSLGRTQLSEALPSGRFTLVARLPGGREARAEVELLAGQETPVRLAF